MEKFDTIMFLVEGAGHPLGNHYYPETQIHPFQKKLT